MSVKVMGWVWDQDLPRDEKFILLAYADHANHEGYNIFPAVATVAKKTGYSERSTQRITRKLEERGLLKRDGTSHFQTKQYYIPMSGGDKMTPPTGGGVTNGAQGGDKMAKRGDIAMSPEPSFKPSLNHNNIKDKEDNIWERAKTTMHQQITGQTGALLVFRRYVEPSEYIGEKANGSGTQLLVRCQNEEQRAWLADRYTSTARRILMGMYKKPAVDIEIEFVYESD